MLVHCSEFDRAMQNAAAKNQVDKFVAELIQNATRKMPTIEQHAPKLDPTCFLASIRPSGPLDCSDLIVPKNEVGGCLHAVPASASFKSMRQCAIRQHMRQCMGMQSIQPFRFRARRRCVATLALVSANTIIPASNPVCEKKPVRVYLKRSALHSRCLERCWAIVHHENRIGFEHVHVQAWSNQQPFARTNLCLPCKHETRDISDIYAKYHAVEQHAVQCLGSTFVPAKHQEELLQNLLPTPLVDQTMSFVALHSSRKRKRGQG